MTKFSSNVFVKYAKNIWLVISLILIIFGQAIIREPQPINHLGWLAELFIHWNEKFYWSLKNPVNILFGLLLITVGLIVSNLTFKPTISIQYTQDTWGLNSWDLRGYPKLSPLWLFISILLFASVNIQLTQHQYTIFSFWSLVLAILIPTILFFKCEAKMLFKPDPSITYLDGIFVFALFAFAIAAGSYYLNDLPAGWITDEGPFWVMARKIALGSIRPPFFDFGVFTFPVASSYLQGWILRWAGINMWGWRFSSVLPAALTIFPLYFLARLLFIDRRISIAACVLMIANPYFLLFSRLGYNNSQSLFPVCMSIYFFVLALQKNSFFYLWLTGLMTGLCFYTYFAAWIGIVTVFIAILCLSLISKVKISVMLIIFSTVMVGTIAVLLPRVAYNISSKTPLLLHFKIWETSSINTFYGQEVFGAARISNAKIIKINNAVQIYFDPALYKLILLRGAIRTTAGLFDPLGYTDHPITYGMAGPGTSIFFVIGLGLILANSKKIMFFIPSVWFLIGFLSLGVLASLPPRPTHMVALIPVISLIASVGLIQFLDAIITSKIRLAPELNLKTVTTIGMLFFITVTGFLHFFYLNPYYYNPPNQDDYISWLGRQFPTNSKLILVDHYSTTKNPMDETLLKLSKHPLLLTTREKLVINPSQIPYWANFVAFVDWRNGREYAEWIAGQIPNTTVQVAYTPDQHLQGYIVSDLEINSTLEYHFLDGVKGVWNSPVRKVLLFSAASIVAFFIMGNNSRFQVNPLNETIT